MEVTGKIIMAFPEASGVSKAGNPWKKREYVLETLESRAQKIFFDLFGDRADQYPLEVGQIIRLSFDINSREYNGRWYTSISGWRVEEVNEGGSSSAASAPANEYNAPVIPPAELAPGGPDDDLPF